ncbi:H-NS histone family protein [Massilia varians]|uniref:H-NS histone family protein n=1 Tax=Massilia varians TaxID=457921 RepID=UPI0025565F0B|nr:H-NS histone family protein [Massilia varians]MDK6080359.1 H-NS histone family protein [Massilia varians]
MIDLLKLDYSQLRELGQQVAQQISVAEKQELKRAAEQIEQIAKSLNMSVPELLDATGVLSRKAKKPSGEASVKGPALYQNPQDASQTWTGRGRKPFWLAKYLESGGALEALRIAG